jgi:hypothetical protein
MAWWESKRREPLAWAITSVVFVILWTWHVSQVLKVMPPTGWSTPGWWPGGWAFVMKASLSSVFFVLVPEPWDQLAVAVVIPLLWAGSWYWAGQSGAGGSR